MRGTVRMPPHYRRPAALQACASLERPGESCIRVLAEQKGHVLWVLCVLKSNLQVCVSSRSAENDRSRCSARPVPTSAATSLEKPDNRARMLAVDIHGRAWSQAALRSSLGGSSH